MSRPAGVGPVLPRGAAKLIAACAAGDFLDRSFAAAAASGFIAAGADADNTQLLLCHECVLTGLLAREDREVVGSVRAATSQDIMRVRTCLGCCADLSAAVAS